MVSPSPPRPYVRVTETRATSHTARAPIRAWYRSTSVCSTDSTEERSDMPSYNRNVPQSPSRKRLGWIVDVQYDFMVPPSEGGRLYVHHLNDPSDEGARRIIPALARTARWLAHHADAVVYTGDWHADADREIDRLHPDFLSTYPAHCMGAGND